MDEELICPRVAERRAPPQEGDLLEKACQECPSLMREVDERGVVTYHCLVYKNRFRSPGIETVVIRPPTRATRRPPNDENRQP